MIALFNYGGGMRGLVPAHIMARIEDATGLRMAEMVDIFSGPSTGAILNGALNRPHPQEPGRPMYKARHIVKFYEREGIKIFTPDSFRSFRGILHDFNNRTLKLSQLNWLLRHGHYSPENLARPLRALFGETRLSETLRSVIIPTYNIDSTRFTGVEEKDESGDTPARTKNNFVDGGGHAVWLKNIVNDKPDGLGHQTPGVPLFDAVMASCAAPTYFPSHHLEVEYPDKRGRVHYTAIDGNMFDNPCISYLGAIRRHVPADTRLTMIVLGTGYTNRSVSGEDWNRYGALGIVDPVNDMPLVNIFFHASESALLESFQEEMGRNLFVFNKSMIENLGAPDAPNTQIDDASPENLKRLRHFAETIIEDNQGKFDELCHILVKNRDRRQHDKEETARKNSIRKYLPFLLPPEKA